MEGLRFLGALTRLRRGKDLGREMSETLYCSAARILGYCETPSLLFRKFCVRDWAGERFSSRFLSSTVVNVIALLQGCSYWSQVPSSYRSVFLEHPAREAGGPLKRFEVGVPRFRERIRSRLEGWTSHLCGVTVCFAPSKGVQKRSHTWREGSELVRLGE